MKKLLSLTFLLSIVGMRLAAHDLDGSGRILVPINVADPVPGAHGTVWVTELWFHNGWEAPVQLRECPVVGPPCPAVLYEPGVTVKVDKDISESQRRTPLLYQLRGAAPFFTFSSRLYELSRATQPAGVYVPVVREEEFFHEPRRFLAIPGGPTVRVAVRFYDLSTGLSAEAARIEVFDLGGEKIGDHVAPVSESLYVPVAEIHDIALLTPGLPDRFDIRVSSIPGELTYWALVSVTDNETQQVLLVEPD